MSIVNNLGRFIWITLVFIGLGFQCPAAAQYNYPGFSYLLDAGLYENDSVVLNNISIINEPPSHSPSIGDGYAVIVIGHEGSTLSRTNIRVSFDEELRFFQEEGIDDPMPPLRYRAEKTEIFLRIPGSENATKLILTHNERVILEVKLSDYICDNDGILELGEGKYACPDDHGSSELSSSKGEENEGVFSKYSVGLILLGLIAIVLSAYFLKKRTLQ